MSLFGGKELAEIKELLTEPSEKKGLNAKVESLKRQISDLEIQRDKKQEDFDRRERELTHMIGLEKKRQEVETKQAKQEATLAVREENLAAERKEFEKQMKFREDRFDGEVKYLKGMVEQILGRLPTVNVDRQIKESAGRK